MIYNVQARVDRLLENDYAAALLEQHIPGIRSMIETSPQAGKLSLEKLVKYSRVPGAAEKLIVLEAGLKLLNTPENAITPSEQRLIDQFHAIDVADKARPVKASVHHQDAIYPGQPWLDTKGERIQAHGGAVYYENGVYYWYGENKEHTDGRNGIWTWGIRVYSSTDLYNWEDLGYLIPPVLDDPNAAMFPTRYVDRPHLLKCPDTGKYVCWIKLSGPDAAFTIWQADALLGPYEKVENLYQPGGYNIGDFDMISDAETGDGYIWFDADHTCVMGMRLTRDYLHAEAEVSRSYPDLHPPFTREGPAVFEANGCKYLFTSGMTGYVPNRSDAAQAASWQDTFRSLGDPHVNDDSCASFNSQITKVFRVEGKDGLLIAMADRWLPDYPLDKRRADVFTRAVAMAYDPAHYQATDEERKEMLAGNVLETANTSLSDYVWLPITWSEGKPQLVWRSEWRIET